LFKICGTPLDAFQSLLTCAAGIVGLFDRSVYEPDVATVARPSILAARAPSSTPASEDVAAGMVVPDPVDEATETVVAVSVTDRFVEPDPLPPGVTAQVPSALRNLFERASPAAGAGTRPEVPPEPLSPVKTTMEVARTILSSGHGETATPEVVKTSL